MTRATSTAHDIAPVGDQPAGFTLIELLVAMTLLSLIFVALFGGLRLGVRAWETGNGRSEGLDQVEIAHNLIRRQLRQAWIPDQAGYERATESLFEGAARRLRFVAPSPPHLGIGGFSEFLLEAAKHGDGYDLALSWRPYRSEQPSSPRRNDTHHAVLVDAVESVTFSYYGKHAPGTEPDWQDQWDSSARLPPLVRLRVVFPAGDNRYWPELLIAPRSATVLPN